MKIDEILEKAKKHGIEVKRHNFYSINKPDTWLIGILKDRKEGEYEGDKTYSLVFDVIEGELVNRDKEVVEVKNEEAFLNAPSSLQKYFWGEGKESMVGKKFIIAYKGTQKVKGKKNSVITYNIICGDGKEEK